MEDYMLTCFRCGKQKDESAFPKKKGGRGRGSWCIGCVKERQKELKALNYARVREYKATRGCARCRETDFRVLVFHHPIRRVVSDEPVINRLVPSGAGWEKILSKISACEILCLNCHMKEHYEEIMVFALAANDPKPAKQTDGFPVDTNVASK
jgi:hypothetical protein